MKNQDIRPIIILGMERSGTSLLRGILSNHSQIAIPPKGELQPFSDKFYREPDIFEDKNKFKEFCDFFFKESKFCHLQINPADVLEYYSSLTFKPKTKTMGLFFQSIMTVYAKKQGKPIWVEKSTSHILNIDKVLSSFPDAFYLLVVRDLGILGYLPKM